MVILKMNFMKELNELKTNKRSPRVIHHYCMDVDNYSYFDSKFIGDFLADLVSIYEGKDFIYQDTILENDSENKRVKLIIAKEYL